MMRGMEASRTIEVTTLGECLASFVADTPGPMAEASTFTRYVAGAEANVAVGLARLGHEVAFIGHVGAAIWAPTLNNPANRTFMQLAEEKLKRPPSYFHAVMYSAGRWVIEAVKSLDGNADDRDKLLAAIRKASETTPDPRGPIKLDEYGNPTENIYIVKVEKVGGKLQNTVLHTYPMVSQFWTYKADEFLKMPAYDRNYPPVKP